MRSDCFKGTLFNTEYRPTLRTWSSPTGSIQRKKFGQGPSSSSPQSFEGNNSFEPRKQLSRFLSFARIYIQLHFQNSLKIFISLFPQWKMDTDTVKSNNNNKHCHYQEQESKKKYYFSARFVHWAEGYSLVVDNCLPIMKPWVSSLKKWWGGWRKRTISSKIYLYAKIFNFSYIFWSILILLV